MQHSKLRERYTFIDFLYYTTIMAVPLFTAFYAVGKKSIGWLVIFILLGLGTGALIYRFFCSHCPHYTQEGKTIKCMFWWGMPKIATPSPGPLGFIHKTVIFLVSAILLLFPLYWLFQQIGLLVIYILSLIAFLSTIRRNECSHCLYLECPANKVPEEIKSHGDTQ